MLPPGWIADIVWSIPIPMKCRIAPEFCPDSKAEEWNEDKSHRDEDTDTFPAGTDHPSEGITERSRDQEDRDNLDEVGKWCGIFKRVGGVRIEETAPVYTQLFDRNLRCSRTQRDCLGGDQSAPFASSTDREAGR